MVLDTSLLNTQHYKVRIEGKVGAIQGKKLHPPQLLGVVATKKGDFGSPSTTVANFTLLTFLRSSKLKPPHQIQSLGENHTSLKGIQSGIVSSVDNCKIG